MKGLTFSDLHLFAHRSRASGFVQPIREAVSQADVVVLNGDIFDVQWTQRPTIEVTVRDAIGWLDGFVGEHREQRFHYVLGNHDIHEVFVTALQDWSRSVPNIQVHEHLVRIGRSLFLHGDCANWKMTVAQLAAYREEWRRMSRRSLALAYAYEAADILGLTKAIHLFAFPRRRVFERILHYVNDYDPRLLAQVDDVYFGHTHLPFTGQAHGGLRFHNTGSAIKRMGFNMLWFDV